MRAPRTTQPPAGKIEWITQLRLRARATARRAQYLSSLEQSASPRARSGVLSVYVFSGENPHNKRWEKSWDLNSLKLSPWSSSTLSGLQWIQVSRANCSSDGLQRWLCGLVDKSKVRACFRVWWPRPLRSAQGRQDSKTTTDQRDMRPKDERIRVRVRG